MKTTQIKSIGLALIVLAGLTLGAATSVQAGRGHHGHGHLHHAHRHYDNGYRVIYNQPRVYYNRQYYPQPAYNYYPAAPAYGYPGNVTFGINTGNASFMLRY
ncbi:MAG: hypothetical protein AAB306_05675 [Pseudomonadota bacterium]